MANKTLVENILDVRFSSYTIPRIAKPFYSMLLVLIILDALAILIIATVLLGAVGLLLGLVFVAFNSLLLIFNARMSIEIGLGIVSIALDTKKLRQLAEDGTDTDVPA